MRYSIILTILAALAVLSPAAQAADLGDAPRVYVPYKDLPSLIDPADKAVLMDREEFAKLLAAAEANKRADESVEIGQVTAADYQAKVANQRVSVSGALTVVSMSDEPVSVALGFGQIGLTELKLDGKPAPLGYDKSGRLVLVLTRRGEHKLTVAGTTALTELRAGGMKFGMSIPAATAGQISLTAPGDLEIHSGAPVTRLTHDEAADRTTARLTVGGMSSLSVVLLGNGRRDDQKAIILGDSATTVQLSASAQTLNCLYTAEVLRRGVRDLTFLVPARYAITDVSCPALVRWEVRKPRGKATQQLVVRLRTASRGTKAVNIQATASRSGSSWTSPAIRLDGADFEQGHLLVDTGGQLNVRGQSVRKALRVDLSGASVIAGLLAATQGRLYYHWSDDWRVYLDLAEVQLRSSSEAVQLAAVAPEELHLSANFSVTAIGRELFEAAFDLPDEASQWRLQGVTVNGSDKGFEYRVDTEGAKRTLKIFLARPVPPEGVARIAIDMRHVPGGWSWQADSPPRDVTIPLIRSRADSVSGKVGIAPLGDLEVAEVSAPRGLRSVTVGRMAAMNLPPTVQIAWSYDKLPSGAVRVRASRLTERIAAESIGLATAQPAKLLGNWRIGYRISRARTKTLYMLADKSLGRAITVRTPGRLLASKDIVEPGPKTVELSKELASRYDLWQLTLDSQTFGDVIVDVSYDRPLSADTDALVPLVRPIGAGQISEMLAIQASDELAVSVATSQATDVDTVDLPPLPAPATRLLRAMRIESPTGAGANAAVALAITVHEKYEIPSALATEARLTTYLGTDGSQQTEAVYQVANAGLQFLAVRLPAGAELWSVRVGGSQARPKKSASGDYLVAIGRSAAPQEVKVVYSWTPPASIDKTAPRGRIKMSSPRRIKLGPARLPDVKINRLSWRVYPPPGHEVAKQYTDMTSSYETRPGLAGLRFIDAVKSLGGQVQHGIILESKEMANRTVRSSPGWDGYSAGEEPKFADMTPKHEAEPGELSEARDLPADEAKPQRDRGRRSETPPVESGVMPPPPAPEPEPVLAPPSTQPPAEAIIAERLQARRMEDRSFAGKYSYAKAGRDTLPIEIQPVTNPGAPAEFWSLGSTELEIELGTTSRQTATDYLGMAAVLLVGFFIIRAKAGAKIGYIALMLVLATITAIWCPFMVRFANGAFWGAMLLVPVYIGLWVLGGMLRAVLHLFGYRLDAAAAAAAVLTAVALVSPLEAHAGGISKPSPRIEKAPPARVNVPLILPYEGDPNQADANANKVLISYRRFAELWNRAHPDDRIAAPEGDTSISVAGARYAATLDGERLTIQLSADVRTFGKAAAKLPVPMTNLAVTEATLAGKPADIHIGDKGMVLTLPGEATGTLTITAVTTAKLQGPRGGVSFVLPPLPVGVLTIDLPADIELQAPGAEAEPTSKPLAKGARWTVPVGMRRNVTLKWSPKVGAGAADRTLSAAAAHDVYALHWALVGVSKINYTFSAGQHERFGLLVPADASVTAVTAPNLRDFREAGERTVDGEKMKVIEVRLHRPAEKNCTITARWVRDLPSLDKPHKLSLPRAAEVGRESGTLTLRAAPGMNVKVDEVVGGRRADAGGAVSGRDARTVARYYWPYRPFSLNLRLSRHAVEPAVRADQLVRVDREEVQLLVQAKLTTERGKIFGASFVLPDGYELLSAVGPVVEDHYEQPTPTGRRLHVDFRSGVESTTVALVLVRKDADLAGLAVPTVSVIDAEGKPLADQAGRLAVQVAASLDAQTAGQENLRAVAPRLLGGWLDAGQVRAVQFAYAYEDPKVSLRLKVVPQKTRLRVEVFGGLSVQPTAAWYSYRLRYKVDGTPIDRVRFTLPTKYAPLVAVRSPAMRSVSKAPVGGDANAARTEWTVSLIHEVTGTLDVTVNFAAPIDMTTTQLVIPRLSTDAPEGYRAILAVQNASRHELAMKDSEHLEPLAQSEQAKLLAEPIRRNLQFVLQSFTDDWSASLSLRPARPAARASAIVDLLALTTVMDRKSQCRYEVRISLQNRTHQFLRIRVPKELTLWSANVAGQAVKPVSDPNAPKGVVLIPLVKTEPGGLPYDVKLYLAGRAGKRFGMITEIKPPAVTVAGIDDRSIDVVRTTWTLRLPSGYRYLNPGGNLSHVGRVEEKIVKADALVSQFGGWVKGNLSLQSDRSRQVAQYNFDLQNRKLTQEIEEAQQELAANKLQLSGTEYSRLQQKVTDLSNTQDVLESTWKAGQREAAERLDNNVNGYLNDSTVNPGVMEAARNDALLKLPDFVTANASEQLRNIREEIVTNEGIIAEDVQKGTALERLTKRQADAVKSKQSGKKAPVMLDSVSKKLLSGDDDDRGEQVAQVLDQLEAEQRKNFAKRQVELQAQITQLGDNRLERYYASNSQMSQTRQGGGGQSLPIELPRVQTQLAPQQRADQRFRGDAQTQTDDKGEPMSITGTIERNDILGTAARRNGTYGFSGIQPGLNTDPRGPSGGEGGGGAVTTGGTLNVNGSGTINLSGAINTADGDMDGTTYSVYGAGAGLALPGGGAAPGQGIAAARGTFSLPVRLPEGGLRLDFQGPGDTPSVTVLAVEERLIDGAHSTGAVLVIFLAALLVWKVLRQAVCRSARPPRLFGAYLLLLLVVAGLFVADGISLLPAAILAGVIIVPVELLHRLLSRRAPAAA